MLLGPQNVGRIISLPEPDLALVQMDVIASETGAMVSHHRNTEEHYTYLDMNQVYFDYMAGYWRPKGTVGDRSVPIVLVITVLALTTWLATGGLKAPSVTGQYP